MTGMNRQDNYSGKEAAEELCWMPPYTRCMVLVFLQAVLSYQIKNNIYNSEIQPSILELYPSSNVYPL